MIGSLTARARRWWHVHAVLAIALGVLIAFLVGAFAGSGIKTVFGTKLNKRGQQVYAAVSSKKAEAGLATGETLPPALAAKVRAANARVLKQLGDHPHPLATPEPKMLTQLVQNYSYRSTGARPVLLVAHDTESPNAAGLADVEAIRAWFNNPRSQASSNYTTDADGNTIYMVPDTRKAWTQAYFNSWAISDELIGHATQKTWPEAQLRAVAEIFAHEAAKYGIPIRLGAVSGCTIVRSGIVDHAMLGGCGGGHHDDGPDFPMAHFIALVQEYARAGTLKGQPKPKPVVTSTAKLRAKTGYWNWLSWYLGEGSWKAYGPHRATVRPRAPRAIPRSWWARERAFVRARR